MDDTEINLQEFNERITVLFERYKEELNSQEHPNVNHLLYHVNNAIDNLLYQVKYEIEQLVKGKLKDGESVEARNSALNNKKAECLIKLQTLTSELTCRIMEDYRKKVEENKKKDFPM